MVSFLPAAVNYFFQGFSNGLDMERKKSRDEKRQIKNTKGENRENKWKTNRKRKAKSIHMQGKKKAETETCLETWLWRWNLHAGSMKIRPK